MAVSDPLGNPDQVAQNSRPKRRPARHRAAGPPGQADSLPADTFGIPYQLIRSRRRTLSLIVYPDQRVEVRCPLRCPLAQVEQFIRSKADWIERKRQAVQNLVTLPDLAAPQEAAERETTRRQVATLIQAFPGQKPVRVVIRRQKSRWGSCSNRGTISINSRAACLPDRLLEYIVYHELCHLVHFNHGPDFWRLLQSYLPDARHRQKALRLYHLG